MGLLEDLNERILIADGAMGTLLYANGIDSCFEELNLSRPELVFNSHQSYIDAGADLIQTNTYGANYQKLARYGLQDHVTEINSKAVRLAKDAAEDKTHILGTVGGIRGFKKGGETIEEIKRNFREQLYCLLWEGVHGLLFETYYDLEELTTVLKIARKETSLPLIAQVSLHEPGILQDGTPLGEAFNRLEAIGADVIGLNCRLGPYHMTRSLEQIEIPKNAFLSAYPNAGLPEYVDGKLIYQSTPDYFEESALAFRSEGVRLIGGCCGTTPKHIEAMANRLANLPPITSKTVKKEEKAIKINGTNPPQENEPGLHELARERRSVIVELDPPKKLNTTKFFEGAKSLEKAGVDALTLADNSLATPRISNMSIASILKNQLNQRSLVHVACRDRNLIGLQSHLMGLHTLGVRDILAVTGDPTKIGDFPGATSVYDCNSIDLIQLCKQFNDGVSSSGKSLGEKTSFSVAGAFNPNVPNLDRAVRRLERKAKAGADYFLSQPIFSEEQMIEVYHSTKHLHVPIYIGIMPLTSSQNAEFLHNEVPGINLSPKIRERLALFADDREKARHEGIKIAQSLLDAATDLFNGIYLITPFMRYEMTVELVEYINRKDKKQPAEFSKLLTRPSKVSDYR